MAEINSENLNSVLYWYPHSTGSSNYRQELFKQAEIYFKFLGFWSFWILRKSVQTAAQISTHCTFLPLHFKHRTALFILKQIYLTHFYFLFIILDFCSISSFFSLATFIVTVCTKPQGKLLVCENLSISLILILKTFRLKIYILFFYVCCWQAVCHFKAI